MKLLGLIPEQPFDPRSWSGSSAHFFQALQDRGMLAAAVGVELSRPRELWAKARTFGCPLERWRARFHSSTYRFDALSTVAARLIASHKEIDGVLQVGAWFSSPSVTELPCFSYHDGNAAQWYRHYGRDLLSTRKVARHLAWEKRNYEQMRGILVMSQWLGDSFANDFGIPISRIHVVGAGINFHSLPPLHTRTDQTPRFLFVGKDFERKGGRFLLEAFQQTRTVLPDAELHIVGPPPGTSSGGIFYHGFLNKSEPEGLKKIGALFNLCTILVLPSIYEPFGISLLEGMAHSMACIATDCCAMPEIVSNGETGLIAKAGDSVSLAQAMIELARSPSRTHAMGALGRTRVESNFTWDVVAARVADAINRMESS